MTEHARALNRLWDDGPFAVHFGVYPPNPVFDLGQGRMTYEPAMVDGHTNRSQEHEIDLPGVMVRAGVTKAYVSGSWGCWGPADQSEYDPTTGKLLEQSEGDDSLHVVFYSDNVGVERIADLHAFLTITLLGEDVPESAGRGRAIDHAVITTPEDWSQQSHIATIGGNPWVCIYETTLVASGSTRRDNPDEED